ncbi:hypothetical protein GHK50_29790 [Sinorhizobium medicae]|uniref:Uncharacterized protein n=1 Tax=Sinorhizobium medicae TaxID=110321 RepID=A0A6G1WE04_9HYPH|nr:hypothetical protein [Sinorhizobium medicae]MDX0622432.1 hypothetical protein [Sinorhizobium medicae]MQW67875.1 hypothetical protein [Sinorhizobium medicae]MQX87070.1 hypothetical protein [Sinorhizobium medicae]
MQHQPIADAENVQSAPPSETVFGREERSFMRVELDEVLSLLSLALHALKGEHEYQLTQVRPRNLPSLDAVIKTINVGASKLEGFYLDLQLPGDAAFDADLNGGG